MAQPYVMRYSIADCALTPDLEASASVLSDIKITSIVEKRYLWLIEDLWIFQGTIV